jgi:hypothetical protein
VLDAVRRKKSLKCMLNGRLRREAADNMMQRQSHQTTTQRSGGRTATTTTTATFEQTLLARQRERGVEGWWLFNRRTLV